MQGPSDERTRARTDQSRLANPESSPLLDHLLRELKDRGEGLVWTGVDSALHQQSDQEQAALFLAAGTPGRRTEPASGQQADAAQEQIGDGQDEQQAVQPLRRFQLRVALAPAVAFGLLVAIVVFDVDASAAQCWSLL